GRFSRHSRRWQCRATSRCNNCVSNVSIRPIPSPRRPHDDWPYSRRKVRYAAWNNDRLWACQSSCFVPDSITTSAHKLLNVLYDSALVTCRHPRLMMRTVYAVDSREREPNHFTLEGSRRARGADIWGRAEGPAITGPGRAYRDLLRECATIRRGPRGGRHPNR